MGAEAVGENHELKKPQFAPIINIYTCKNQKQNEENEENEFP